MTHGEQPKDPQNLYTMAVHGHVETRCGEIIHVQTKVAVPAPLKRFGEGFARHKVLTHISESLSHTIKRSHLNVFDDRIMFQCSEMDIRGLVFNFLYGGLRDFLKVAETDGDLHLALEKVFRTLEHILIHNRARKQKWCHVCVTDVAVMAAERQGRLTRLYHPL